MAFSDDFARALQLLGINIDASSIPSQDVLQGGLNGLRAWLDSLDPDTKSAADEVTAEFPVKAGLADPQVNIAPGLSDLLGAFDKLQASFSISAVLNRCTDALQQVDSASGAFSDHFAQALQSSEINIDAASIPPRDVLQGGLDGLRAWLDSLDSDTKSAADEVTAEFPVKAGLADPQVNIAPGLSDLLGAFDKLQASFSISAVLDRCSAAMQQVPSVSG